jgi:ketosteroid isomerase-like protein
MATYCVAMSEQNVDILRRAVEAFDRGADEEWIAAWQTDAELYDFIELPDVPRPYRGREGVRRWGANVRSVLGDFHMTPQAFTPAGDAILMDLDVRGVGEQSGVPVAMNIYILAWIRDGKIARTRAFLDREQALEAAGLSE